MREYLNNQMKIASEKQLYEDAARYRDQLNAVISFTNKQKKTSIDFKDRENYIFKSRIPEY